MISSIGRLCGVLELEEDEVFDCVGLRRRHDGVGWLIGWKKMEFWDFRWC